MPLGIYQLTDADEYEKFSDDSTMSNPITTVHHGRDGDTCEQKLYIKADNGSVYTNIQVKAITTGADDIGVGTYRGTTGWGIKLKVDPGHSPTETEWDAIEYGVAIDIDLIDADATAVRPFWFRIESPLGISVGNKENNSLQILYTET